MLETGAIVAGRYRIERTLGRGATATVYAATQVTLGRLVALKLMDRSFTDDAVDLERFQREGRLHARLDHPAILPILDAGACEEGLYLVTKFVDGSTLRTLIRRGDLPPKRALDLLAQVAVALDHAHDHGLVHRDVKPHNVLVGPRDQAFLSDFGLTRDLAAEAITRTGQVFGTLAYLAPEVIQGAPASGASDRYAFAAMTYECLSGTVPFPRPVEAASLYAHTTEDPPPLSRHRSDLAPADRVVSMGLAKAPGDRPPRANDLIAGVRDALGEDRLRRLPAAVVPDAAGSAPRVPVEHSRPRRHVLWGAAGAGVLAIGAAVLLARAGAPPINLPPVPANAVTLGSMLDATDVGTVNCDGALPTTSSAACTIAQETLHGQAVIAPSDGVIVAWHVRGASGRLRLQVLREIEGGWYQAYRTGDQVATHDGIETFGANLRILAGDRIGIEIAPGSAIGISQSADDVASTLRWFDPIGVPTRGAPRHPTLGAGTGMDVEVFLRVDMIPGRRPTQPQHYQGVVAERHGGGPRLAERVIGIAGVRYEVVLESNLSPELVLVSEGTRLAVMYPPGITNDGRLVKLDVSDTPEGPIARLEWFEPRINGTVYHEFIVHEGGFELVS